MPPDDDVKAFVPGERVTHAPTGSGPLDGLTFAVKDLFDVAGAPTTYGNPDWARTHPVAAATAPAVLALLEAGGTLATSTGSVLVRLRFQLADGVAEAALTVSDAVLAAADESESLATTTAGLTVVNATVQRG